MTDWKKTFLEEADKRGSAKAMMSDVVGMPDDKDKEFIRNLVQIHERLTGGLLAYTIKASRTEFEAKSKFATKANIEATVSDESRMTYDFELPNSFVVMVEKYYPTMFRDRKHYAWFKKNLKGLMVRPNDKKDWRIKKATKFFGDSKSEETLWKG